MAEATIYRVTMPTDDCSVFTVAGEKKNIYPEGRLLARSFVRHVFPHAATTTVLNFFSSHSVHQVRIFTAEVWFFLVRKKTLEARKETREPRGTMAPGYADNGQTMLLIFMGFSG